MKNFSISDIISLAESVTLECKAAQGRNGNGEVPDSFWETYSAMANTNGGEVYLGIEEKPPGVFRALGIKNPEKLKKSLWDTLHAKTKVNRNILGDANVQLIAVDGKTVIQITIPRARRQDRTIHLGTNPFGMELPLPFPDNLETSSPDWFGNSPHLGTNSPYKRGNSHDLSGNYPDLSESSQGLNGNSQGLSESSQDLTRKRDAILASFGLEKVPGKMTQDAMRKFIVRLCDNSFVTLQDLSKLLNRNQTFIQQDYISGMLSEGLLELKYPDNKNHPNQAYRSKR